MTSDDRSVPSAPAGGRGRLGRGARAVGRGGAAGARYVGRGGRYAAHRFRTFAAADGAADTGLAITVCHYPPGCSK